MSNLATIQNRNKLSENMSAKYCANIGQTNGYSNKPFIIGVAGGTASGKTSVCSKIIDRLKEDGIGPRSVSMLCIDSFYRDLTPQESELAKKGDFNFDHPDAIDMETLTTCLNEMNQRHSVQIPIYSYATNSKSGDFLTLPPSDVILCEGILIFYFKTIRDIFDMKLFVDTDADTRLARRVKRDIMERGRHLETILHQYLTFVKPAFEEFCLPTKKYADIIIPRGANNTIAIDLIVQHIKDYLKSATASINIKRLRHSSDSIL